MLYDLYEMNRAAMVPFRAASGMGLWALRHPLNPLGRSIGARTAAAALDVFESVTRPYGKPKFGLDETTMDGRPVPIVARVVWRKPFCDVIHFEREPTALKAGKGGGLKQPKILIVAPLSGHYATLLRGTVEAMLPHGDIYITDWSDARMVPVSAGRFDLEDYTDYLIEMMRDLGPDLHVLAVCQPAVPVFTAVSVMSEANDPLVPLTMTLMGGPIDTRESPTEVNTLATSRGTEWYRRNMITTVPFAYPGGRRSVYPGFLQLTGFMAMNLDRHVDAHWNFFEQMIAGDGESAQKHREFYDEYLSVMDMTSEFYLQTVDLVFVRHALPKGELTHRGRKVQPSAITRTALMTVEGEKDDISGIGQTRAAHRLASNLAPSMHEHWEQAGIGHYGVFNGSRWREEIAPRVRAFMNKHGKAKN